jgi:hypothetical protein
MKNEIAVPKRVRPQTEFESTDRNFRKINNKPGVSTKQRILGLRFS